MIRAGLFVLLLTATSAGAAQTGPAAPHLATVKLGPSELIEDADLRFAYNLVVLRSKLSTARIMIARGRYQEAMDMIGGELARQHDYIVPALSSRGLRGFRDKLTGLRNQLTRSPAPGQVYPQFKAVEDAIWQAYDSIEVDRRSSFQFRRDLAVVLIRRAAAEYQNAWIKLQLRGMARYHEGYSVSVEAQRYFAGILPLIRSRDRKAADAIDSAFQRLRSAWPAFDPPLKPVMPYSTVNGLVAAIEIYSRKR